LTHAAVEDFGEHLVVFECGYWVVCDELDRGFELADHSHGLGLGNVDVWLSHDCELMRGLGLQLSGRELVCLAIKLAGVWRGKDVEGEGRGEERENVHEVVARRGP